MHQIAPRRPLSGARAHHWQQTVLPLRTRGQLHWGLSNIGHLAITKEAVAIHEIKYG
ncbi:glycosyl transferase, group 1 [Acidithiobacillus caldus ATCC 51756]|nr:glycosyl transferase, group 1 [Acidithiobacillus caldus ATCC 51756]